MSRWILVLVPFVTCTALAFSVFVVGAPRSLPAVRLYGGPTEGASVLVWTLEVAHRLGDEQGPAPNTVLAVEVNPGRARSHSWQGTARQGRVDLTLGLDAPLTGRLAVQVRAGDGRLLASGPVQLDRRRWRASAKRRGGWLPAQRSGALRVDVAPARGALAVDVIETLLIRVQDAGGAGVPAHVRLEPSGAAVARTDGTIRSRRPRVVALATDPSGYGSVRILPRDFVPELRINAEDASGRKGEWSAALPVVAAALHAARRGSQLTVTSPIPRQWAFYSIVSDSGRLAAGRVRLAATEYGQAAGHTTLPEGCLREPRLWAVVSPEPHLDSAGTVGWPIAQPSPASQHEPQSSWTVADRMLLDGHALVSALHATQRRKARLLAGLFAAAAVGLMAMLAVHRIRSAQDRLESHLRRVGQGRTDVLRVSAGRRWVWAALAVVLLLALGYSIIALVAMARVG